MPLTEVFPNPTVKQVIFQITFPNLFYLESKIGDIQLAIMERFPNSAVAYRRLVFGDLSPDTKPADLPKSEQGSTIWQFSSERKDVNLHITTSSLDMVSTSHKTYDLNGGGDKFRDIIEFVVGKFLKLVSIPMINRIGLRYVDECPLPKKDTVTLLNYYNSVLPVQRFPLEDAVEMVAKATVSRKDHQLSYTEVLVKTADSHKLLLDFDGFANNVRADMYLTILDQLHLTISAEFERTIKEPVYEYMRLEKGK